MELKIKTLYSYPNKRIVACMGVASKGLNGKWQHQKIKNCPIPSFSESSHELFFKRLKDEAIKHDVTLPVNVGEIFNEEFNDLIIAADVIRINPRYVDHQCRLNSPIINFQFSRSIHSFTAAVNSARKANTLVIEIKQMKCFYTKEK
jgi:hypothetical protein